jgi:hypothetical protein
VVHFDFTDIKPLADAETTFYRVGVSVEQARCILDEQLASLKEMARFIVAQICASVIGDMQLLTNYQFVAGLDINRLHFDSDEIHKRYAECRDSTAAYHWTLNPQVLRRLVEEQSAVEDEAELFANVGG